MELWIASHNSGKIKEFERILQAAGLILPAGGGAEKLKLHSSAEIKSFTSPPEDGKTFYDNACIKARALHSVKPTEWVLADDSGIEVEGIGGLPGVHSARYAGPQARDVENYSKLVKMVNMRSPENRKARFVAVLVVYDPKGREYRFDGIVDGSVAPAPRGTQGFGYDPIFIPDGHTKTLAEIDMGLKNKLSHRARAMELLIAELGPLWKS